MSNSDWRLGREMILCTGIIVSQTLKRRTSLAETRDKTKVLPRSRGQM